MTMKRGIIRMTEGGKVSMPLIDVWMTKGEIADMFGLLEASVFRAIRSIHKKSELNEHEAMQRIPFPRHEHQGWMMEVYNLDLILYLTYKLPSRNAQIFRKYMMNKAYERSPYEHICIIVDDVDFRHQLQSSKEE
ncbi:MAG: hypothetical protein IJP74_04885 [Prevotella sp.]|nr:hypothetical protein [Prevotella sp.]